MNQPSFDELTDLYDAMVDWPKRLSAEASFYRPIFERAGVRSVADVSCGTGRHAAMFHSWGLEVAGSDISPAMIARAEQTIGRPAGLTWRVQGFDQPVGPTDAVVCLGNSLSLAPSIESVEVALRQMIASVRAGGVVAVGVLNLWKLPDGPCVWQKSFRSGESMVLKGVHRAGDVGWVELVVQPIVGGALRNHSVRFWGLSAERLTTVANDAHADVQLFGGVDGRAFDPATSTDLILIATRR